MRSLSAFLLLLLPITAGTIVAQPAKGIRPPPGVSARYQAIYIAPIPPAALRYLTQSTVQTELNLTAKQKEAVANLGSLWDIPLGEWRERAPRWVPVTAFPALVAERTDAFLAEGLTQDQQTRLNQVVYQLKEREFGAHAAFAMAARELQLRADQSEDLTNIKATRVEEILKAVTSAERFEKVKTKVEATNGDTFEKMAEMLTRAQRERLKDLKGRPFGGKVNFADIGAGARAPRYPADLFGVYDLELRYLADASIRQELTLSEAQVEKLTAALAEWEKVFADAKAAPGSMPKLHDATEKALADNLTPAQRARLDQVMLQRRARVGPEAMCGHPAAVAVLKLTPIQLEQLRNGQSVGDVLTVNQAAKLEGLLGKPFDLPKWVKDPFLPAEAGGRPTSAPYAFARYFLALSERLKLSADQVKKLRELAEDEPKVMELIQKELGYPDVQNVIGPGRGAVTADAVRERYKAAVEEQCWNVLDAQQQSLARKMLGRKQ